MTWKNLFAKHILQRGYDYYCDNAVENIAVSENVIIADVVGSEDYEVEITLNNGKVSDMYCSCPYASDSKHCKHMAAVLYEWFELDTDEEMDAENEPDTDLFQPMHSTCDYKKRLTAMEALVDRASETDVRKFLAAVLIEDGKLLLRFHQMVNKQVPPENVDQYIGQIDEIADRYMGRDHYISYYRADDFISELEEILDVDVRRMIDNDNYFSAFRVMNYIFILIGDVDMDDSSGGRGMLADHIYQLWLELLVKVSPEEKRNMFHWFTSHLNGSVMDYFEEFIEQIVLEEFNEQEYEQTKIDLIQRMIAQTEQADSAWSRDYHVAKWALRYLDMLKAKKASDQQITAVCQTYWTNSSVRRYYLDLCMKKKQYDEALQVLDECILLDKSYAGLISEYSKKKKEIYLLQGNHPAYIEQLWQLVLEHDAGDLELYRELKKQYSADEWLEKREDVFKNLPKNAHVERLYREEKLYDRLLAYVINAPGLYALQEHESVLKKEYPEQLLDKYKDEIAKMAAYTSDRKQYAHLVSLLRKMQQIKGGSEVVEQIANDWRMRYKNRRAMMDELEKL